MIWLALMGLAGGFYLANRKAAAPASPNKKEEESAKLGTMLIGGMKVRGQDEYGEGRYGASRSNSEGNARVHAGVDYVAETGSVLFAPFDGEYIREASPYADDERYRGMVVSRVVKGEVLSLKIFYVTPNLKAGRNFKRGDGIGVVQNLRAKYRNITNHIHVEALQQGKAVDPTQFWS